MRGIEPLRRFAEGGRQLLRAEPRLRALLLVQLLAMFNAGLLVPVLPLFLLDRGLSLFQLGALFSLVAAASVGVQLLAGRFPERLGRPGFVVGLLLGAALLFPAYLLVDTPRDYFLVSAGTTLATSAATPGLMLLLALAAPEASRAVVFSYVGVATSFAYAVGLVTGGALLAFGYPAVFYAGAAVSLATVLVLLGVLHATGAVRFGGARGLDGETAALLADVRRSRAEVRRWQGRLAAARGALHARLPWPRTAARNVRWASLYLFLFTIALAVYPVYFPRFLVADRGLAPVWVGAVVASSWIAFGVAQPIGAALADRTSRDREIIAASLVVAAALNVAMALVSLPWIVVSWALLGVADGLGRPVTSALLLKSVPPEAYAATFGWTEASQTAARVAAPYALAFVVSLQGIDAALLAVGAVTLLSVTPLLLVRKLPAPSGGPA